MALSRLVLVVARSSGQVDRYPVRPKVQMHFERTYKVGMSRAFEGDQSQTNLYRLAWECERAEGGVVPDLDTWLGGIEAIDAENEEFAPFDAALRGGDSPSSPSPQESPPPS